LIFQAIRFSKIAAAFIFSRWFRGSVFSPLQKAELFSALSESCYDSPRRKGEARAQTFLQKYVFDLG
jgi:hypothetical protein